MFTPSRWVGDDSTSRRLLDKALVGRKIHHPCGLMGAPGGLFGTCGEFRRGRELATPGQSALDFFSVSFSVSIYPRRVKEPSAWLGKPYLASLVADETVCFFQSTEWLGPAPSDWTSKGDDAIRAACVPAFLAFLYEVE